MARGFSQPFYGRIKELALYFLAKIKWLDIPWRENTIPHYCSVYFYDAFAVIFVFCSVFSLHGSLSCEVSWGGGYFGWYSVLLMSF